jgi:hypothetical protein
MAIHTEEVHEVSKGLSKEIDESAMSMIFDNLQKHQYQFPIKSTIRELVSNAVDASREKLTAIKILTGEAKEEDYYIRRDEPMYRDSNFHKEYYDLNWLEANDEPVRIIHQYGGINQTKDMLIIKDSGAGLGNILTASGSSRLSGYFKLGYSSRRNSTVGLGKFGLGAKSPLSTGTDYYTMITRHNGKEYQFNIYSYKVDSMVPRWDLITSEEREEFVFAEGTDHEFRGYCLNTTEKNGTEIHVPTKKLHRQSVIDSVKNQLLYFRNVDFYLVDEDEVPNQVDFQANILYEDEFLIISDNDQFSKPHMVLNGVNYGYVNFAELELEDMRGNVGFKVKPEDVEINPSRESLIWLGKTNDAVLNSIKNAAISASRLVQSKLKETDFIKWLRIAHSVVTHSNADPVIGKLGTVVDRTKLTPAYEPNPLIKFKGGIEAMFEGLNIQHVYPEAYFDKISDTQKVKAKREQASTYHLTTLPIYIQTEVTLPSREVYLCKRHPDGFVKIRFIKPGDNEAADKLFQLIGFKGAEKAKKWNDRRLALWKLLRDHPDSAVYDTIIVPKEVEDELNADEEAVALSNMTPEELRKMNAQIVVHAMDGYSQYKEEPKLKEVLEDSGLIVYGSLEDRPLLQTVALMLRMTPSQAYSEDFKLLLVSKQNVKHFRKHTHVHDFIRYYDKSTKTIGMHNRVVQVQTARKITAQLPKLKFLENFEDFNSQMHGLLEEVKSYAVKYGSTYAMNGEIDAYADKVVELQLFIEEHREDPEAIAIKSMEIFDTEFEGAVGIDLPVYRQLETLLEYVEPIHVLMNAMNLEDMSFALESEVREILRNKHVAMD